MFGKEVIVLLFLVSVLLTAIQATCVFKGVTYPVGPIVTDNPCDHCFCPESGTAACAIVDCFYPMFSRFCADGSAPVHHAGQCCPTCANIGEPTPPPEKE